LGNEQSHFFGLGPKPILNLKMAIAEVEQGRRLFCAELSKINQLRYCVEYDPRII
jgi:hypothetical protein